MSEARIVITADAKQAASELDRLKASFGSTMASVESTAALATKAIGFLAIGAAALSFATSIREAIDLADSLNKLSQRTGVSTESLSQLQYAAKLADVSTDSLSTGLKKLNINIAAGVAGDKEKIALFKSLGVTLTDTTGKTKSADQVLLDLADTFSKSKDGAGKTAAAVALLGKAGDEMIPLLNGGRGAIEDMKKEADKLGLTISSDFAANAESFNDNLTRIRTSGQKLAISLAGDLVKGLGDAMQAFANTAVEGGKLQGVIAGLQTLLTGTDRYKNDKALVQQTDELFFAETKLAKLRSGKTRTDELEAERQAQKVLGIKEELNTTLAYRKVLDEADDKAAKAAEALKNIKSSGPEISTPKSDSGVEKINPQIKAYNTLIATIREKIAANTGEVEAGRKLTDTEKQALDIRKLVEKGTISAKDASSAKTKALIAELSASEQLRVNFETRVAAEKALRDEELKRVEGLEKSLQTMLEQNKTLAEEVELIGLDEQAQTAITQTRQQSIITIKEEQLARLQNTEFMSREQIALEEEIRLLKERMALTGQKAGRVLEATQLAETKAGWSKFYGDLQQGLTDSLFRAFESGKGFFSTFWDGIKNLFKTTVLKLAIQGVVGGVTGALGLSSTANAAAGGGSGGGLLGTASNLSSLYSGVSNTVALGSQVFAGTMSVANALGTVAANATGTGISGLLATNGAFGTAAAGTASGVAGGVTAALGAIGPAGWAVIAAVAVASIFGGRGKKEMTGGGIEGTFSADGFSGNNFSTWKQKGGWFRSDRSGKETSALDAATVKQFSDANNAVRMSASAAAVSLGLSADAIASYSQNISLQLGKDAAANEKAVNALFSNLADNLALTVAPSVSMLKKEGESASEALARLSGSLTGTNSVLSTMRLRLFSVSLAGADAASKLVDLFGGMEGLATASKAYYDGFYSEAERSLISTQAITSGLASLNIAAPKTKSEFRSLVEGLDLNTEAGRSAYAALIKIAPEFAANAELAARFAKETADKLLVTFTAGGRLTPALNIAAAQAGLTTDAIVTTSVKLGYVSRLFLNVNSGLLSFGGGIAPLPGSLSAAQRASAVLVDEIDAIQRASQRAGFDLVGLTEALASVDTTTFLSVIDGVLSGIAARISEALGTVASERVAVRDAALQIIGPTVMSRDAIARAVGAVGVGSAPNNAALAAAQQRLSAADTSVTTAKSSLSSLTPTDTSALTAATATLAAAQARLQTAEADLQFWGTTANGKFREEIQEAFGGYIQYNRSESAGELRAGLAVLEVQAATSALPKAQAAYDPVLSTYSAAYADYVAGVAAAQARLTASTAEQAAAVVQARTAQLQYITSLQDFSIDASKAVGKLGKLREETVKYYEAQSQLASLMTASASAIRSTVDAYRFDQLDPTAQFNKLQEKFATAYTMALSTDGEVLAGYGDKLNTLLNPLLAKAQEVLTGNALEGFINTTLARADNVAGRIEALTPKNYAADSLALLGQIDATLLSLDVSSKSAEKLIADAVTAGSDKTAQGLRAVIAALTGQTIPAFASGGSYMGGLALVGEQGPELINFNQPGQVYTAGQTRGMFAGGGNNNADVVAELRALRQDNANMRAELRAIAVSNAFMQKLAERTYNDGQLVVTAADQPLKTTA